MVGLRRGRGPDAHRGDGGCDGRECARGLGRLALGRAETSRARKRRAGPYRAADCRRIGIGDRERGRSARNLVIERRRSGGILSALATEQVFAKAAWRLIPFMALLYLISIIDRLNVGFAALTMNKDLGFSPTVFGFGAGVFFVGYLLF